MKLTIERPFVAALVEEWPDLSSLSEQLRFGDQVEVPVPQLNAEQCAHLGDLFHQGSPDMQLRAAQLATLRAVLDDGRTRFSSNDLEAFLPALMRYLLARGIRGWVFSADVSRRTRKTRRPNRPRPHSQGVQPCS